MNRPNPEIDLSEAAVEYFEHFFKLSAYRTQGMNGPDPLQPGTIIDWCRLTRNDLETWELELLATMDAHYLKKIREMSELHREADKQRSKGYNTNGYRDDRL